MEINLDSSRISNIGAGYEMHDVGNVKQTGRETEPVNVNVRDAMCDTLQRSEPLSEVPDAALVRDDDLGKLVNAVFDLQPPPMPAFVG